MNTMPNTQDMNALLAAADKGESEAQYKLGKNYLDGQHFEEARKWLTKAAEQNHSDAQYALGKHYSGIGVQKNLEEAIKWLQAAAQNGNLDAPFYLSDCYQQQKDFENAMIWLQKAAEQGHLEAQYQLAFKYLSGDESLPKDTEKATALLQAVADNHMDVDRISQNLIFYAQYNLACCYLDGIGGKKDAEQAANRFRALTEELDSIEASTQPRYLEDSSEPQPSLNDSYCTNNYKEDLYQILKEARFQLALLYLHGIGVTQDINHAIALFERNNRHQSSRLMLGVWLITGPDENIYDPYENLDPVFQRPSLLLPSACRKTTTGLGYIEGIHSLEAKLIEAYYRDKKNLKNILFDEESSLCQIASSDEFDVDSWIINHFIPDRTEQLKEDIYAYLERKSSEFTPAKVVLSRLIAEGFFKGQFGADMGYSKNLLEQAASDNDLCGLYYLGCRLFDDNNMEEAQHKFHKVIDIIRNEKQNSGLYGNNSQYTLGKNLTKITYLQDFKWRASLSSSEKLKNINLQLLQKQEQKMLSYLTHTLRNALAMCPQLLRDAIALLGSTEYEKDRKHYRAINKIASLFSSLSLTDCLIDTFKQTISEQEEFRQIWQQDQQGEATPQWVIGFALRQSLCRMFFLDDPTALEKLIGLEGSTAIMQARKSFLDEVLPLTLNQDDIDHFFVWVSQHIPCLDIQIQDTDQLHFGVHKTRFSLLFAITSELILNALKYWNGQDKLCIIWRCAETGDFEFRVTNSCNPGASSSLAGTHKGLAFIKRLMELLGEQAPCDFWVDEGRFVATVRLTQALMGNAT